MGIEFHSPRMRLLTPLLEGLREVENELERIHAAADGDPWVNMAAIADACPLTYGLSEELIDVCKSRHGLDSKHLKTRVESLSKKLFRKHDYDLEPHAMVAGDYGLAIEMRARLAVKEKAEFLLREIGTFKAFAYAGR